MFSLLTGLILYTKNLFKKIILNIKELFFIN